MSFKNIVVKIICNEFYSNIGRCQNEKTFSNRNAMLLNFNVVINNEIEKGFRNLNILLYSPDYKVGVFVKESWNVTANKNILVDAEDEYSTIIREGKDYIKGETRWLLSIYDDTYWRDGIYQVLSYNYKRINGITGFLREWYKKVSMTKDLLEELAPCMNQESNTNYMPGKEVFNFEEGKIA